MPLDKCAAPGVDHATGGPSLSVRRSVARSDFARDHRPRPRAHRHRRGDHGGRAVAEAARTLVRRPLPVPQGEVAELPREPGARLLPLLRLQGGGQRHRLPDEARGPHVPRGGARARRARRHRGRGAQRDRAARRGRPPRKRARTTSTPSTRSPRRSSSSSSASTRTARLRARGARASAASSAGQRRREVDEVTPGLPHRLRARRAGTASPTFLEQQGVSPIAAETVGLLVPRSSGSGYYDRFRHRLMFAVDRRAGPRRRVQRPRAARPPRRPSSRPDARALAPRRRRPPPKYINSPESPIYTKGQMLFGIHQARHAIRQRRGAVLVEGNFDVVSLHARGIDQRRRAARHRVHGRAGASSSSASRPTSSFLFDGDPARPQGGAPLARGRPRGAAHRAGRRRCPTASTPTSSSREKGIEAHRATSRAARRACSRPSSRWRSTSASAQADAVRAAGADRVRGRSSSPTRTTRSPHAWPRATRTTRVARLDIVMGQARPGDAAPSARREASKQALRRREAAASSTRGAQPAQTGERRSKARASARERRARPSGPRSSAALHRMASAPRRPRGRRSELGLLEGESAMRWSPRLRRAWNIRTKDRCDTDAFLAPMRLPRRSSRLRARSALPNSKITRVETQSESDTCSSNANKLKRLLLSQRSCARSSPRARYARRREMRRSERELLHESARSARAKPRAEGDRGDGTHCGVAVASCRRERREARAKQLRVADAAAVGGSNPDGDKNRNGQRRRQGQPREDGRPQKLVDDGQVARAS